MNAHLPQSYESMVELEEIAAIPHHIVAPRHAKPLIGVFQDTLVGSYRLTQRDVEFTRREFMSLMMWNRRFDGTLPVPSGTNGRYTGQQVLSALLPPVNIEMANKSHADKSMKAEDSFVKIQQGNITQGVIDGDIWMKPSRGIVHVTYNDHGEKETVDLLDALQNTVEHFLVMNGFSVGISDLVADDNTMAQINQAIQTPKKKVDELIMQLHLDLFDNNTGKTNQQEFEDRIFGILNDATSKAGDIGQTSLSLENRLLAMVRSGSKGEKLNVAQMMACLGQTAIEGKRVPYGLTDRTLPHYKKYDDSAESRGFIESSFIRGLTPQQFFFHAMSGREGLIDTAVKSVTADTEIILQEHGRTKWTTIGSWIDGLIDGASAADVEHHEQANMELLNLTHEVYIPTCDAQGVVSWGQLTAVTRHDPGESLYKVTTLGGRKVTVAKSQSLIVWSDEEKAFVPKPSPEVKPGEYVPAICHLSDPITPFEGYDHLRMIPKHIPADVEHIHDVTKDAIVSVEEVSVEAYPKLYDVTVPSTLNFAIANGLVVRDTADTGYIQRQLVKSMEDLVVQHDGTVRDTNNNIVQFHYGEDGVNPTKIETQTLDLGHLSEDEIWATYGLKDPAIQWAEILEDSMARVDEEVAVQQYVAQILEDRRMLVENVLEKKSTKAEHIFAPVNLKRWILNIKTRFGLKPTEKTDLTPARVLQGIQTIIDKTHSYHMIWAALLRFHLAPHRIILEERFTVAAFEMLMEMIVLAHMKAWVQPGDQVGIVAAQSIGEPATQMSVIKSTICTVICGTNDEADKFYGSMGDLVDSILEKNADRVRQIAADSVVLTLEDDYYIVGVSDDEKTSWKRISEVSRHPANGGMVEVVTRTGRRTTATLSHSFLKRSQEGIVPVLGSDLKVGMRIPVAKFIPESPDALTEYAEGDVVYQLDREFGWICGIYLADGCFTGNAVKISKVHPVVEQRLRVFAAKYDIPVSIRNYRGKYGPSKDNNLHSANLKSFLNTHFKTGSFEKELDFLPFFANTEFICGFIGGFFDGDGNVKSDGGHQSLRASSRNKKMLDQIASLLGYAGIFGSLCEETSIRMPDAVQYTLQIPRKFAQEYKDRIGFALTEKAAELDKMIAYNLRQTRTQQEFIDKIPELGHVIAETGKLLRFRDQSRTYGRWAKKDSIGRQTLEKYVAAFEARFQDEDAPEWEPEVAEKIEENLAILRSALDADVFWDEIVELVYHDDPKEYVYDFTVPGNDSFMVDNNILVHNTLNTFHQAGVASKSAVTRGVPRLRELLKVTQNPKATSLTIYLKPEYRNDQAKAREVMQELELTILRNITDKVAIYWDKARNPQELTEIKEDQALMEFFQKFERAKQPDAVAAGTQSKWVLRLELNREEMFNRNIAIQEVVLVIKAQFPGTSVVYTDYNSDKLVMRIQMADAAEEKQKDSASTIDRFTQLKKFQNKLLNTVTIRGVPGIKAATFRKDSTGIEYNVQEKKYMPYDQFVLDTDGSNYARVMAHPAVDGTRLYSTNVWDVFPILGIEATRVILFNEIQGLFGEKGTINYRHLCLLCDVMTRFGRLMSIDRYGINKNDIGTLAKASFEETEKILLKAALFGEVDPVTGVSANVMMGQPIRGGTAFSQILLDDAMLPILLKDVNVDEYNASMPEEEELGALDDLAAPTMGPCASVHFQTDLVMPTVDRTDLYADEPDIGLM